MSAMTVNSFPSMHNWNSPRAWALAIIVLLHLGFFWALTNGLSITNLTKVFKPLPPTQIQIIEKPTPPEKPIKTVEIDTSRPVVTRIPVPIEFQTEPTINEPVITEIPRTPGDFTQQGDVVAPPVPLVVEPRIDARRGLSEPYYPPDVIRGGGEGTVVLSIYILADGRVGDVRLISSSGITKLDQSAMREAKKWRFVPGTSDGKPMAMWKQLPVTFRLNTRM